MKTARWDVIVIGAGIGGLAAGSLLANSGYKVLVLEKHSSLGGRCGIWREEGFTLPAGAVAIHYRGTAIEQTFKELGLTCDFIDVPKLYYRIGGKDHKMPDKGSISLGFDIINKLEEDKTKIIGGFAKVVGKEKVMGAFRTGVKSDTKEGGPSFKDWLLQYTDNELAHGIFDTITNSVCGAHSYELAANSLFAWFTKMGGARDVAVAPRGNLENLLKLAKVITDNGGEVWSNAAANRITVSGGVARGVIVTKDGQDVEVSSTVVVSDIGPRATVEVAGEGNFTEEYLRNMRVKLRPHPVTMIYIASDRPLWPDDGEAAILQIVGSRRIISAIPLSSISPALAPSGQHLMFAFGGPVSNEVHMDFEVEKQQCLLDLKEQFPRYEKHGRVLKWVFKDTTDELPEGRTRLGSSMPMESPIKNLFNVGDGCCPFGYYGSTGAAESARQVVDIVRKKHKVST